MTESIPNLLGVQEILQAKFSFLKGLLYNFLCVEIWVLLCVSVCVGGGLVGIYAVNLIIDDTSEYPFRSNFRIKDMEESLYIFKGNQNVEFYLPAPLAYT